MRASTLRSLFLILAILFVLTACSTQTLPTSGATPELTVSSTEAPPTSEPTPTIEDEPTLPVITELRDPLNNLLALRSVRINLSGTRPDGTAHSINVEIDSVGNMHVTYILPPISAVDVPEEVTIPKEGASYEVYVVEGKAYAASGTQLISEDYHLQLSDEMHNLEGFTFWLDLLPDGSLKEAGTETAGGFTATKYAVSGTVGGELITGALWYDQASHALVKAELHVPASLDSDPEKPERGEILITLSAEKAEIELVTLPEN